MTKDEAFTNLGVKRAKHADKGDSVEEGMVASCPHCGHVDRPSVEQDEDGYWVECKECGKSFSGTLHLDSSGPYEEIQELYNATRTDADGCKEDSL